MAPETITNYKPGSIRRVRLHNFLTYSDVEFRPGPRLNIVVGPNGTGKSTLLCAICLGLGGQPSLLGRADDARTFIMHEKDKATIEIEIEPPSASSMKGTKIDLEQFMGFMPPHIFKRVIDRNMGAESGRGIGASKYYINDRPTNIKVIKELVQNVYQIQIDNLCTFLPQDKVGNFSGFNAQALLMETEKALLLHHYDTHMKLIELEEELKREGTAKETIEDQLARLEKENEAIEREKELVEQRMEAQLLVKKLQQKLAWVKFDNTRIQALELKQLKDDCKKQLLLSRQRLAPLEEQIENARKDAGRMHSIVTAMDREIDSNKKNYAKHLQKADTFHDDIEDIIASINGMDSEQKNAERRVQAQIAKVEENKGILAQFPPVEETVQRCDDLAKECRTHRQQLDRAKKEVSSLMSRQSELQGRGDSLSLKMDRMNDEKTRRKERIFRQFPELEETFKWVDQNRKLFRRPIHGPIACEVEITSKVASAYLEQHVAMAVWKQYIVECKEDYNLLYRELRDKRKMNVNIHIVPQGKCEASVHRPYSEDKMAMLKREHGVIGHLDEMFLAPPAVLQALRNQANVNSVLVGDQRTYSSLDQGLTKILETRENGDSRGGLMSFCIFSCSREKAFKYTSVISRYSGHSSIRIDEIRDATILAAMDSAQQVDALKAEIEQVRRQLAEVEPLVRTAQVDHDSVLRVTQQVTERLKEAKQCQADYQNAKLRLESAERKLEEFRAAASRDNAAQKEEAIKKLKIVLRSATSAVLASGVCHEAAMRATHSMTAAKMKEDCLLARTERFKSKLSEEMNGTHNLEKQFNELTRSFNEIKDRLKMLKREAETTASMQDSNGNDLPLKAELEKLPASLEDIEAALEEASIKINRIDDNPEVLRQYEDRVKEIARIKEQIARSSELHNAKKTELFSNLEPWEAALTNTVKKVDSLFGRYMEELGMAGEIRLAKAPCTEEARNFKEWGIQILVKFREKAQLQVLSAQVHSGGERSVSTIMYLMALQELMSAPFRCVDEINQGLDERNERLVFKRIVMNSTKPTEIGNEQHSGQYFLITPKLLPNMTDMEHEDVTVLCIFNGPFNFHHFLDWNVNKFLAKKRAHMEDDESGNDTGDNVNSTALARRNRKRISDDSLLVRTVLEKTEKNGN